MDSEYYYYYDNYSTISDEYLADIMDTVRQKVHPGPFEWMIISSYIIVFLFSIIGNSLVCITVLQNEQMRTVTNMYIVNLSIADILVTVLCVPWTVTYEVTHTWFFGATACSIISYIQLVCVGVSIFTLTFIALDRYLAICCPFKYKINRSRTVVLIAIAWMLAIIIALPVYFVHEIEEDSLKRYHEKVWLTTCGEKWSNETLRKLYHIGLVLELYIVPLFIITLAYTKVCRTLWSGIPTEEKTSGKMPDKKIRTSSTSAAQTQTENRKKVARMLIVVVVLFALCYFMTHVMNLLKLFGVFDDFNLFDDSDIQLMLLLNTVTHWFMYFNSAVNPIIYNFLSAKFREEFKALCLCCCRRSQKKRQDMLSDPGRTTEYMGMSCKKSSALESRRTHNSYTAVQTV
ncbi:orexin receptor type 2-like [Antedon mediterranea]|uniref:orexin receptor type 2-like n=1 Tax=Antedon mediterranea TaxID=105859 RepID=UPI003AF75524